MRTKQDRGRARDYTLISVQERSSVLNFHISLESEPAPKKLGAHLPRESNAFHSKCAGRCARDLVPTSPPKR
eukprot:2431321-Rhodomonas_salina.3